MSDNFKTKATKHIIKKCKARMATIMIRALPEFVSEDDYDFIETAVYELKDYKR